MKINKELLKLENDNIFQKVTEKVNQYKKENPNIDIISLGIGDVSRPIVKPVLDKMKKAVDDQGDIKTFKGYGSYYGYDFLKEKILKNDYSSYNFSLDEIYISNGTKTDVSNILELFSIDSKIGISDSIYPIYNFGALCLNRKLKILPIDKESFYPIIPKEKFDIIYLCSPNNPTGIAYSKEYLNKWVKYAIKNNSIILFDNVYYSFIRSKDVPKTIYEIPDARKVAIEFRSFSKHASFTGIRCSYYIIPEDINKGINKLWKNRTLNRFNGADYIAQRGAEETYENSSKKLIKYNVDYYLENAFMLKKEFENLGYEVFGGIDSPFLWVKIKDNISSWDFFELMLKKINIIIIPGIIFGETGDNYFRISALADRKIINMAIERINKYYEKEI